MQSAPKRLSLPSSSTHAAEPEWNINYILRRAFANDQVASWLLAKSDQPPTSLDMNMMKYSVTSDMITVLDEKLAPLYRPMAEGSGSGTKTTRSKDSASGSGSGSASRNPKLSEHNGPRGSSAQSQQQQQGNMPFVLSAAEKMVFVLHGMSGNRAYISVTDSRTPFSFLEMPSEAVPGVRRAVIEHTSEDVLVMLYYPLKSGNACMTFMRYFTDPQRLMQRCAMLLGPYPSNRYPTPRDVLESALTFEMLDCQFCLLRGLPSCDCNKLALTRLRPRLPGVYQTANPWDVWSWYFVNYEKGLKKDRIVLTNHQKNVTISREFLFQINPTLGHNETEHIRGYQHYLNQVFPCFQNKMLSWSIYQSPEAMQSLQQRRQHAQEELALGVCDIPSAEIEEILDHLQKSEQEHKHEHEQVPQEQQHDAIMVEMDHDPSRTAYDPNLNAYSLNTSLINELLDGLGTMDNIADPPVAFKRRRLISNASVPSNPKSAANDIGEESDEAAAAAAADATTAAVNAYLDEITQICWTQDTPFTCRFCDGGTTFTRKYDLKRHVQTKHLPEARRFECEICSLKFKRREHLESHMRQLHAEKTEFPCALCGKVLLSEVNRRRHMKNMHSNLGPSAGSGSGQQEHNRAAPNP